MYRIIIIDDEPLARSLIRSMLSPYPDLEIVAECGDGFEGFKAIGQYAPDLIFLDVQMPKLTGFEMLEMLEAPPAVIFTTAFDQYAIAAFEANAADYLLKPINRDRLDKAITKWRRSAARPPLPTGLPAQLSTLTTNGITPQISYVQRIVVKDRDAIRIIPTGEIEYLEAADDYVKIFTADGVFLKKTTLSNVERSLDPQQFVRVHRSFIIPVAQISKIEPYEKESHIARLHCGAHALVSKTGMSRLKEALGW